MAAWLAIFLALLGGSGWLLGKEFLTNFIPGMPTMKMATASMILLLGIGVLLLKGRRPARLPVFVCSLITLLISLYFLANPVDAPGTPVVLFAPSRATSATAGLLALAQLMQLRSRVAWPVALVLVFASLLPLHRLTTFVVGYGTLHTSGPFDSMSLPTSMALFLIGFGQFLGGGLPYGRQLICDTLQGQLLRLSMPWALLGPPVLAVLFTLGAQWGLYNIGFVVVSVTAALSALMIVLLWLLTVKLQGIEDVRAAIHQDLMVSERYANQLIDASPDALVVVDGGGRIIRANAQTEYLFGYPGEKLRRMHVNELLPERFREAHIGHMQAYIEHPSPHFMGEGRDLYALHESGREVPVEIAIVPVDSVHGRIVLANVVDISERLNRENELRASLREKTVLLNEVHHRVKNNLQIVASLLSLQGAQVRNPEFRSLIAESEGRVRVMSLLHQILYERKDFAMVELDVYLQRLADLQTQMHRSVGHAVRIQVDCAALRMELTRAIPLGLLVNELLSNAFKHAFKDVSEGELRVTLRACEAGRAKLVVRDNGPGFSVGKSDQESTGLGMQIVSTLSDQIGAELNFAEGPGGCVELEFEVDLSDTGSEPVPQEAVN